MQGLTDLRKSVRNKHPELAIRPQLCAMRHTGQIFRRRISGRDGRRIPGDFMSALEMRLTGLTTTAAIIPGHFRGEGMPVDLAVVGARTLTLLLNNGSGRFERQEPPTELRSRLRPSRSPTGCVRSELSTC